MNFKYYPKLRICYYVLWIIDKFLPIIPYIIVVKSDKIYKYLTKIRLNQELFVYKQVMKQIAKKTINYFIYRSSKTRIYLQLNV